MTAPAWWYVGIAYAVIARYTPNIEAVCNVMDRRGVMLDSLAIVVAGLFIPIRPRWLSDIKKGSNVLSVRAIYICGLMLGYRVSITSANTVQFEPWRWMVNPTPSKVALCCRCDTPSARLVRYTRLRGVA